MGISDEELVRQLEAVPQVEPPEMKNSTRPPIPARTLENTSLFASFHERERGVLPARMSFR